MSKVSSPVLVIFAVTFCLSFTAKAVDNEEVIGDPGAAGSIALKRYCGLGLSRLNLADEAVNFNGEAKRAWGLYRVALWRLDVLEEQVAGVVEKFRNYGNACLSVVREKHCRGQGHLPSDVIDVYERALSELNTLLQQSDVTFLESLANDKEHRAYKLPKGHEMIKGLLEVKAYGAS